MRQRAREAPQRVVEGEGEGARAMATGGEGERDRGRESARATECEGVGGRQHERLFLESIGTIGTKGDYCMYQCRQ